MPNDNSYSVQQYTPTGQLAGNYPDLDAACRASGLHRSQIQQGLRDRSTDPYWGFVWRKNNAPFQTASLPPKLGRPR